MTDPVLERGEGETFKGLVHLGLFGLGMVCLAYNALAWMQRRERHLLVNTGVYGALVGYEVVQVQRHLRER